MSSNDSLLGCTGVLLYSLERVGGIFTLHITWCTDVVSTFMSVVFVFLPLKTNILNMYASG